MDARIFSKGKISLGWSNMVSAIWNLPFTSLNNVTYFDFDFTNTGE
jgi:hypothetical protein